MRIRRVLPPSASPIGIRELAGGISGCVSNRALDAKKEEMRRLLGVQHVYLLSSGKAALSTVLRALHALVPKRDRVVIPAYTCYSVPAAVMRAGLKVDLCDIDAATLDFDHHRLEQSIGSRTLAVVPDHLFGLPADLPRLVALCRSKGVFIVEDASQALGERCGDRYLGTIGDAGVFSFGRGKNVTCGGGGAIVTNSVGIARQIDTLVSGLSTPGFFGGVSEVAKGVLLAAFIRPSLFWFPSGLPFLGLGETVFNADFQTARLSGAQAGLLGDWWLRLQRARTARMHSAEWLIEQLGLTNRPRQVGYLRLPVLARDDFARDTMLKVSAREGLGLSAMYPAAIEEALAAVGRPTTGHFPVAETVARRLLAIPTHELVERRDLERIAVLLRKAGVATELKA